MRPLTTPRSGKTAVKGRIVVSGCELGQPCNDHSLEVVKVVYNVVVVVAVVVAVVVVVVGVALYALPRGRSALPHSNG